MARTGPPHPGSFPYPILSSTTTAKAAFGLISGAAETQTVYSVQPSPILNKLRRFVRKKPSTRKAIFAKLRRLSPVWLVPAFDELETQLLDIDVKQIAQERAADHNLVATRFLRSTPLILSLAEAPAIGKIIHTALIDELPATRYDSGVLQIRRITEKLYPTTSPEQTSAAVTHTEKTSLAARRGVVDLVLEDLPQTGFKKVFLPSEPQPKEEVGPEIAPSTEHMDMSLLSHKICEDPDFPAIPVWHKDYAAQLEQRKFVLQIPEKSEVGFFYHVSLVRELLWKIGKSGQYPTPAELESYRRKSRLENYKTIRKIGTQERASEINRLIRCKIESVIWEVAYDAKQMRAIRYIQLDVLKNANFFKLSTNDAKNFLEIEMEKEKYAIDRFDVLEKECVCDIISNYSADVSENWFTDEKTLSCTRRVQNRKRIEDWRDETAKLSPNLNHTKLITGNGDVQVQASYDREEVVWAQIALKSRYVFNRNLPSTVKMIVWDDFEAGKCVALPDVEEAWEERSEGFYSNMSGLSDVSIALSSDSGEECGKDDSEELKNSDASAELEERDAGYYTDMLSDVSIPSDSDDDSSEDSNEELEDSESSLELAELFKEKAEPPTSFDEANTSRELTTSGKTSNSSSELPSKHEDASLSSPKAFGFNQFGRAILTKKLAVVAMGAYRNARRMNSLRMAHDGPHRAHGQELPGYRDFIRRSRPAPDWDNENLAKPEYVRQEEMGIMERTTNKIMAERRKEKLTRCLNAGIKYEEEVERYIPPFASNVGKSLWNGGRAEETEYFSSIYT